MNLEHWGQRLAALLGERTHYGLDKASPSLKQQRAYFQTYGIDSLLPYREFDPKTYLFHNEQSVGFVIETYPMVGSTEEMQREISGLFKHTLKSGASLQFILYADPRVGGMLQGWQDARCGELYHHIAARRSRYLEGLIHDTHKDVTPRNFRCFVSYSQPGRHEGDVETMALTQTREHVLAALKTLGVPVKLCHATDLIQFLDGLINFQLKSTPSTKEWHAYDAIHQQIPDIGMNLQIEPEGLCLGEGKTTIRTYSVARSPRYWSLHAMGELIGNTERDLLRLKVPFIIHYGMTIGDQRQIESSHQKRNMWLEKQAHSRIGRNLPTIKAQYKELEFVREQTAKGERYVQSQLTAILLAPTDQLIAQEHILKSLFLSKQWELKGDDYIHLQQFLSTLPMMWGEGMPHDLGYHRRLKTTLTSESANLLPLQGEWKGNSTTGMPLVGRRGQLFFWDPFATDAGNYNVSVIGRSGSGKSVFMQELVMNALSLGGQVFIIDVGRSFEKTVKLLGGTYIEFTARSTIGLNPFSTIPTHNPEETADALAMLRSVVSLMAAPKEGTNDLETAFIERSLSEAWQAQGQQATITDVASALKAMDSPIAQSLGAKLYPYTREGSYGRFFEGPATVNLNQAMVVVELEELKERKDLQSVILQLIILQIINRLYMGDRKTRSYLVLDEAWDLLRARQAGEFIETAARRFRKYKGSLVVGTQSVHDFYSTPGAQAAFDNSDWLCMLSQKKESIDQLKKMDRIALDEVMEAELHSLKTVGGEYAEIMIKGPHGYAIGRLALDPFSNLLYSTKAEEFTAVYEAMKHGATLIEAIDHLSSASKQQLPLNNRAA